MTPTDTAFALTSPDHDTRGHEGEEVPKLAEGGIQSYETEIQPAKLANPDKALRFILAGNAYFTLRSKRTGNRYTYRVGRAKCSRCGEKDCHCWAHPLYFVSVLTGPQNTTDYKYIGVIKDGKFQRTQKSKLSNEAVSVRAFGWVFTHLVETTNRLQLPMDVEIWHEARCGRCGRKLTVPESIADGLGPECAGRVA